MDLNWIEDLLSLSETRSFSRSADARHVTQSTLSKRIRALEDWVGAELVDRRRYPIELTTAGILFAACGREVSGKLQDVRFALQRPSGAGGMLRVAAGHVLASHFFSSWWQSRPRELAHLRVSIHPANIHASALALVEGDCDLLLAYHHDAISLNLNVEEYESVVVGEDMVIPVSVPAPCGKPRHQLPGSAAQPASMVQYAKGSYFQRVVSYILATGCLDAKLSARCESDMVDVVKALVLAGNGLAWLPRSCVERELAEGRLACAGGQAYRTPLAIRCWRPKSSRNPFAEQLFSAFRTTAGSPGRSGFAHCAS